MKIIAFIMSIMLLVLSCMPCMDRAYGMNNSKAKTGYSKSTNKQQQNDTDNCSPFCTCNCCTGFTLVFNNYQPVQPVLLPVEKAAIDLPAKISNIALPVWQPPQLG